MKLQPIILAAGKGTRMKSELPKPLFEVNGKPMIRHVIEALAGDPECLPPIIVIGHGGEHIKAALGDRYIYAEQTELSGTATAVKAALPHLSPETPAFVLYGDNPFITTDSIVRMRKNFEENRPTLAMFTVTLPDFDDWRSLFSAFGRVKSKGEGEVLGIVEFKHASEEERQIKQVTPGGICFDAKWLTEALDRVKPNTTTGEYYLTDLIEMAIVEGRTVTTVPMPPEEAVGINSIEDAQHAQKAR